MTRARQARLLVRPLLRTLPLGPLAAAGACAVLVLRLEGDLLLHLRAAAVALCLAAAFALDDAAAETTSSSPTPLLFRRFVRLAVFLPLVAAVWALLLVTRAPTVPRGALTLELAAMLVYALAAAALADRFAPGGRGGLAGGPALLVGLAAAALALPESWTLFASNPDDPHWAGSHGRWAIVLVVASLALLVVSLDPGRRRLSARLREGRHEGTEAAESHVVRPLRTR